MMDCYRNHDDINAKGGLLKDFRGQRRPQGGSDMEEGFKRRKFGSLFSQVRYSKSQPGRTAFAKALKK